MDDLRVDGAVRSPRNFSFDELAALPDQVTDVSVLVPGREGGGVLLRAVLGAVGIDGQATHVTLTSTDGKFSASVPLDALGDAVLLYRLGDERLPASKGGPLRFLIPNVDQCAIGGVDACANVKFLGHIELTRAAGLDTRPSTARAHDELHERERSKG